MGKCEIRNGGGGDDEFGLRKPEEHPWKLNRAGSAPFPHTPQKVKVTRLGPQKTLIPDLGSTATGSGSPHPKTD